MTVVYGIPNCDTVKKARRWLEKNSIDYSFHDFRKQGLTRSTLDGWCKKINWDVLLNRRGTTWRKIPEQERDGINKTRAIKLMLDNLTLIKRPVIEHGNKIVVGFDEQTYRKIFK
jgi:arsenate reductase